MKESSTYQAIKEEGRREGREEARREGRREMARRILLRLGEDRFGGRPTAAQEVAIAAITDLERLEELVLRAGHVDSWAQLLNPPASPRVRRKGCRR